MRKALAAILLTAFVLSIAAPLYAGELPRPVDKFVKGVFEIVKSPLALVEHPRDAMDSADNKFVGFFKGVIEAPFYLIKRAGKGAVDAATFPIE